MVQPWTTIQPWTMVQQQWSNHGKLTTVPPPRFDRGSTMIWLPWRRMVHLPRFDHRGWTVVTMVEPRWPRFHHRNGTMVTMVRLPWFHHRILSLAYYGSIMVGFVMGAAANFTPFTAVTEVWKVVNVWQSYVHENAEVFLRHSVFEVQAVTKHDQQ